MAKVSLDESVYRELPVRTIITGPTDSVKSILRAILSKKNRDGFYLEFDAAVIFHAKDKPLLSSYGGNIYDYRYLTLEFVKHLHVVLEKANTCCTLRLILCDDVPQDATVINELEQMYAYAAKRNVCLFMLG